MRPEPPAAEAPPRGLLAQIIGACFDSPGEVLLACALLAALGLWALRETPLDALPELADPQITVMTEWPEVSPTLIEDELTSPLGAALRATPGAVAVRGLSVPGASFVTVLFDEAAGPFAGPGFDPAAARAAVAARLAGVELPAGLRPQIAPASGSTGWALMVALADRRADPDPAGVWDLQEELVTPALASVPGVAEVAPFGGAPHELHVGLDPLKLHQHQIGAAEVAAALRGARWVGGGGVIELGGHAHMLRAEAPLRGPGDLAALPLRGAGAGGGAMAGMSGAPLLLGELAELGPGPGPRAGVAELDGEGEVLGLVVVLQPGVDPRRALGELRARLDALDRALPAGVELVRVYDRAELIDGALRTQAWAMGLEALVLGLVVGLALRHLRSALVILLPLPVAALAAFLPLRGLGVPADLLSLGGLTVAFGALVDGAIVMVEHLHRRLSLLDPGAPPAARRAAARAALQEVGPSLFGTLMVLTVAFAPVFLLEGPEGRLFRPLALTKTAAMGLGAGLSLSLVPAGAALLLGDLLGGRRPSRAAEAVPLQAAYARLVRASVARPGPTLAAGAAALLLCLPLALALGREHLPRMDEGDLLYMPTSPPGLPEADAARVLGVIGRQLKQIPEVEHVLGKAGRADTATDPAPLSMIEATIALRPRADWRPGLDPAGLRAELAAAVDIPGMPDLFWMPIQTRAEMVSTGVRAPLAARLTGPDPAALGAAAEALARALRGLPGVAAAFTDRDGEGLYYDITLDRAAAARVGVGAMGLEEAVALSIGGMPVAELREGRRRTPVRLRLLADARQDPAALARVPLTAHGGALVQLGDVARLAPALGPHALRSEGGEPVVHVFVDPGEAPLAGVAAACAAAAAALPLPGARLEWTGQIAHLRRMEARLWLVVPLTLGLVTLLLRRTTGSWTATGLVLLAVPASLTGAFGLCLALGHHLSGATWVGLLALAGLDAETGVVMLLYLRLAHERRAAAGALRTRADLAEAIVEGAADRLRPKLMTVATSALGLMPLLLSAGPGADLMARVAAPLVGGLASSFLVELLVYPALFAVWRGRDLPADPA